MSELLAIAFFAGLVIGLLVGKNAEASIWRSKANGLMRMESGGRLYRVQHDD